MLNDAWYSCGGPENDVALSTCVRLARNLANYPFPAHFHGDDAGRVQSLVFDSIAQSPQGEAFQALPVAALDHLGAKILAERGVLDNHTLQAPASGIVMRNDGKLCCRINDSDHVHILAFGAGLSCAQAFTDCHSLDLLLQQTLQFAASYDFGFLTSSLMDCGSGMRISVRLHLPSLSFAGGMGALVQELSEKGIDVSASFGAGSLPGSSLGSYYQVTGRAAEAGNEIDQIASVVSAVEYLVSRERSARKDILSGHGTEILDTVYRAFARARFSLLMPMREAVETISSVKWGKDVGFIEGIEYNTLHALLYRIQEGHLQFVLKNGSFSFPADIADDEEKKTRRLRALILQEAFEQTSCKGSKA